jgi:radical SAM protein with 4Fe4S-binding SPASM domain
MAEKDNLLGSLFERVAEVAGRLVPAPPADADPGRFGLLDAPSLLRLHRDAYRRLGLARRPDLTYLFWECTLRCNLRCAHCGSSCEPSTPVDELSTEEMMAVVDTLHEDFDTSRFVVAITGGEPMLRKDLPEVIERMAGYGMVVGMVTNGTTVTPERARRLVDAGLRTVSFSIDGTEDLHDAVRGAGSFAKAMAGVRAIREAGVELCEVITCARPDSVPRLAEVERVLREAGLKDWRLFPIDRMGRGGANTDHLWLRPADVRALFEFIARRRREIAAAGNDDFDVRFACGGFLGVRREYGVRPSDAQCFAGTAIGSILADGKVSACPSLPREWAQGSVREDRFSTIWNNRFEKFRDFSWRRTGPCVGCEHWNMCLGGGLHQRLAEPEEFCWLERQRVR